MIDWPVFWTWLAICTIPAAATAAMVITVALWWQKLRRL